MPDNHVHTAKASRVKLRLSRLFFALLLTGVSCQAQAQAWPVHPIKFIVPYGPGRANDHLVRTVADVAARELGQPIVVENHPGAGSVLGADAVAKSAPDGYTFLTPAAAVLTSPLIHQRMPYRQDDLIPVALMGVSPSVIVVAADSPIKNLAELLAAARHAQGIRFATAGTGSTPHFVAEMLKLKSGGGIQIVAFKSGAESMQAVIGHQVDATSEASIVVAPQLRSGKLRALASTWSRRISALPDIPTASELGFPQVLIGHWSGVFAPKGTPEYILEKMNRAITAAVKTPELHEQLQAQGVDPKGGSRIEFVRFLAMEKARLTSIVESAGMHGD